ncbi:MAG: hypothetical protein OQK48_00785 [Sulfurimonas sp.]|uniref:hypothetical protein n=1 Tax=Sulfurimonas sp. TaxID=2022749 RepID=UPI0026168AED|nr:hypothetical protein [Sulfurimonas sp.]MCW8895136.1 hypothetical protein [Sulfurimonas sp.]MCW8953459.1 hypothetical protein [Sulfurimonas sp.]MCW9068280.1 hypothetical protein [Sulfurimonas sp.]
MSLSASEPQKYTLEEIELEIAELKKKIILSKVNHHMHLHLCIPSFGLWPIVWGYITVAAKIERNKYKKRLNELTKEKELLV